MTSPFCKDSSSTVQENITETGTETNSAEEDTSFFDANGEEERAEAPDLYP